MSKELIRLRDLCMAFDDELVLDNINLYINDSEFLTLLGPSGCGKTTTLRIIGGFTTPTSGDVTFDGVRINDVPPHKRQINTVFQKYALFPHLDVFENIAFGLRIAKVPQDEVEQRVTEMLEVVSLKGFEQRRVDQLSGGQQQRVAIARALVNRPKVLLLDEPLGALDLRLRKDMQNELKRIQQQMGITFIYVTHDQSEAMSISDKIIIMSKGKVEQIGTPREIYYHPKSRFVADFIGEANFLKAKVKSVNGEKAVIDVIGEEIEVNNYGEKAAGEEASLVLRPEAVVLSEKGLLEGTVTLSTFMGSYQYYQVMVGDMEIQITDYNPVNRRIYEVGEKAYLDFDPHGVYIL